MRDTACVDEGKDYRHEAEFASDEFRKGNEKPDDRKQNLTEPRSSDFMWGGQAVRQGVQNSCKQKLCDRCGLFILVTRKHAAFSHFFCLVSKQLHQLVMTWGFRFIGNQNLTPLQLSRGIMT